MKKEFWFGLCALLLSLLACQPVIVIGWNEFLIVFLLLLVLLGPLIYGFLRRVNDFMNRKGQDKQ